MRLFLSGCLLLVVSWLFAPSARAQEAQFKAFTFNVQGGDNTKAIVDSIEAQKPDVFALQEIIEFETYKAIKDEMVARGIPASSGHFKQANPRGTAGYSAVYSRHGIQTINEFPDNNGRYITTFTTTLPTGQTLRFFHTHPVEVNANPCTAINTLLDITQNFTDYPQFLLGDFNVAYKTSCYGKIINAGFAEGCHTNQNQSCAITINKLNANSAIDHIFYPAKINAPGWVPLTAFVDTNQTFSDHFPVIVTFQLYPNTNYLKQNLIFDHSLESCKGYYWDRIHGDNQTTNISVSNDPSNAASGSCYLATNCGGTSCQDKQSVYQDVYLPQPLPASTTLYFGGKIKVNSGKNKQGHLGVHQIGPSGVISSHFTLVSASTSYTKFSDSFQLAPNVTRIRLEFYLRNPTTFFLDDMYLDSTSTGHIPGDLDKDGDVDFVDYKLMVDSFNAPYTIFDFNDLAANFGTQSP